MKTLPEILLMIFVVLTMGATQCKRMPANDCNGEIKQGISGQVVFLSGNFMPGPGATGGKTEGVQRKIHLFKPFKMPPVDGGFYDKEKLGNPVDEFNSCPDGSFSRFLPDGEYSILVEEKGKLYANSTDGEGYINKITVLPRQVTQHKIVINYQATY